MMKEGHSSVKTCFLLNIILDGIHLYVVLSCHSNVTQLHQ